MPTFNQLVKKGRQTSVKKSTAPALQKSYNSFEKEKHKYFFSTEERAYVLLLRQLHQRSLTQLLEKSPEYVCLTESK